MRYIIGLLVAIGLVILLIFVLATGGGNDDASKVPATKKLLQEYANTDATVRMTVSGPIVAEQNHRETRISVTRDSATIESIVGYQGNVVDSETNPNTREGFVSFLRALDRAGFTNGNTDRALRDERGYCAAGKRYIFELIEGGRTVQRFWTTSCTGTETYLGNLSATGDLFTKQIPNYDRLRNANRTLGF